MIAANYRRHRFPGLVIQHAVWLYLRFTLRYRDVEELLAERGLDVSYETIRRWVLKFGPVFACRLHHHRPRASAQWHLDEMVVRIRGEQTYLWRAVDHEGEVLDMLVQRRRDRRAAVKLMRKLLKGHAFAPTVIVTDTPRPSSISVSAVAMSVVCALITERRTRIRSCAGENAGCSASNRQDRRSASSPCTGPSTTPSTTNATSSPARRCGLRAAAAVQWQAATAA